MSYGCHNHQTRDARLPVQIGWNKDQTRRIVEIKNTASTECRYDLNETDKDCAGCKHIPKKTPIEGQP